MSPQTKQAWIDGVLARIEKYGLATVLLVMLMVWARPHLDGLIGDMRDSMKKTAESVKVQAETQAKQAEIQSIGASALQRIESKTDEHGVMIRDIHSKIAKE